MEEFKVDAGKLDSYAEGMEDYKKQIQAMQENVSSIRNGLRHKLSAMEDIGKTLRKIEENLEKETAMMSGFGSALGLIAGNYRNSERKIVDFSAGTVSGEQINQWQQEGKGFETNLRSLQSNGISGEESQNFIQGMGEINTDFRMQYQFGKANALGAKRDNMDLVWIEWDRFWIPFVNKTLDDTGLSKLPQKAKDWIANLLDPMGEMRAVDDIIRHGVNEDNLDDFIISTMPSGF